MDREAGHLRFAADQLAPLQLRVERPGLRRGVEVDLVLDAVDRDRHGPGRAHHGRHHRHLGGGDLQVRIGARGDDGHVGRAALHAVEPRAGVLVLVRLGRALGERLQAHVEEARVVRQPGHVAVVRAVDRRHHVLAGGHVHHVDDRLLRAAGGDRVGDVPAVVGRLEELDGVRRAVGPGERVGVDQQPLGALPALAHVELELVVVGAALLVEHEAAAGQRDGLHALLDRVVELADARQQRRAARDRVEHLARVVGLRLRPLLHLGGRQVLHVAVGVGDGGTEVGIGGGLHRRDRGCGRGGLRQGAGTGQGGADRAQRQVRTGHGQDSRGLSERGVCQRPRAAPVSNYACWAGLPRGVPQAFTPCYPLNRSRRTRPCRPATVSIPRTRHA